MRLKNWKENKRRIYLVPLLIILTISLPALAAMVDTTRTGSNSGIAKSFVEQIGSDRGDVNTPNSSLYIIARDPARAVVRGQRLFQRKFTLAEGVGPIIGDGSGDITQDDRLGAGLADSCSTCHGSPHGSAGFGGNVATRPDGRDAPHLFGLGLQEQLADEITADLRLLRDQAIRTATTNNQATSVDLTSKGISYGSITANPDGTVDTSQVDGVNTDLRVRPFFAQGQTISIREFVVGGLQNEMGLQAIDPDLTTAATGGQAITPSGMVLDGTKDTFELPTTNDPHADPDGDGIVQEIPTAAVDFLEFYLLNYFRPGQHEVSAEVMRGELYFEDIGCASCHIPDLQLNSDRRIADVSTVYNEDGNGLNNLFSTASLQLAVEEDDSGYPSFKRPAGEPFLVEGIYTDFKRHDLGANFHERMYDGTIETEFMTEPLWGVGTTPPYGHDGRSINLHEVILRHGGEAQTSRDAYEALNSRRQAWIQSFLNSLVLFGPPHTESNLEPADPSNPLFPQVGHGSINLAPLFNNPEEAE